MRPKRPCPSQNKLSKIFAGEFCSFSTVKNPSVTEVMIDWPLPNNILGYATAKNIRQPIKIVE